MPRKVWHSPDKSTQRNWLYQ